MIDSNGREVVEVKKADLLDELRKNRDAHQKTFQEALSGWKMEVKKKLTELLEASTRDEWSDRYYIERPGDHTKDYDRVIKMVEMSVSPTVILTRDDFTKYVMDDWEWKASFERTSTLYASNRK